LPVTNVLGGIVLLVLEGTRGPDSHGQDPKMSARGRRIRCSNDRNAHLARGANVTA
jgi:hypothetical protein